MKIYVFLCAALLILFCAEIDVNPDKRGWHIELKRLAANISSTTIYNQEYYEDFSDSRLKGNSQTTIQGFFDLGVNYYAPRYVVFNNASGDYGKNIYKPKNEPRFENKTLDRIILSTDYTHRIWYVPTFAGGFEIGPSARILYQTQFEPAIGFDRRQIVRFSGGFKLFDGVYIKDLHLNAFSENDFAKTSQYQSFGWESGIKFEYKFSKDTKLYYYTNYRKYVFNADNTPYNPKHQLEIEVRFDSNLHDRLSVAPFVKYYALQGENIPRTGINVYIGIAFAFGHTFLDATKKPI